METINYRGYRGSVEISTEDKCLHGKILFINDVVTYEAETVSDLEAEFKAAVDDYLETCKDLGVEPQKPFSGSFNVRIGPDLHKKTSIFAIQNDTTLNAIVKSAVAEYIDKPSRKTEIHNHGSICGRNFPVFRERDQWNSRN